MNLRNENNSCFLDSLLVAMFTYDYSPFLKRLNTNNSQLSSEIKKALNSNSNSARNVRQQLPQEWQRGQHDPGETYLYIVKNLKYENPMKITQIRQVKKPDSEQIIKKKPISESIPCFTIENTGCETINFFDVITPDWEILEPGNFINDAKDRPAYNRTRNLTFFTEAESLVFYFNRCQNTFQKMSNRLEMPLIFDAGLHPVTKQPREFFCYAIIIHIGNSPRGGHYVTILFDGEKQFAIYDDMSGIHPLNYNPETKNFIERNGTVFFYYEKQH